MKAGQFLMSRNIPTTVKYKFIKRELKAKCENGSLETDARDEIIAPDRFRQTARGQIEMLFYCQLRFQQIKCESILRLPTNKGTCLSIN